MDVSQVCPVVAAFCQAWDDWLPGDATRAAIPPPLPARLAGSRATPEVERRRAMLALDWLVRVYAPAWLDLVPACRDDAAALRALPEVVDGPTALAAGKVVAAAGAGADATWGAVWAATSASARAAAWDAAEVATRAAAAQAAAARVATWDAIRHAARDAAWAAAAAAEGQRLAPLAPVVERLRRSAVDLAGAMLSVAE